MNDLAKLEEFISDTDQQPKAETEAELQSHGINVEELHGRTRQVVARLFEAQVILANKKDMRAWKIIRTPNNWFAVVKR